MRRSLHSAMLLVLGLVLGLVGAVVPLSAAHAVDASIRGTVSETGGARLPDVEVVVYAYDTALGEWSSVTSTTTDVVGAYQLGVPAGTYRVGFFPNTTHDAEYYNNYADIRHANDVVVGSGATVGLMEAMLARTGRVTGQVTGTNAVPLAGIEVEAYKWKYMQGWVPDGSPTTTGQDGRYDLRGLSAGGAHHLRFSDPNGHYLEEFWNNATSVETADDVFVYGGETTSGKDVQLAVGASITGTVTGPGGPVAGASVTAYRKAGDGTWERVSATLSGAGGTYRIGGLVAGTYTLRFRDDAGGHVTEYWDDESSFGTAEELAVAAGAEVPDKDAALVLGGRLAGTVTGVAGAPLGDVQVTAYEKDDNDTFWSPVAFAHTAGDGSYELKGLDTGSYRIGFESHAGDTAYAAEYWDDAVTVEGATSVPVTVGETVGGKDARLEVGGAIAGTVTGPHPDDDDQVWVSAYVHEAGQWHYMGGDRVSTNGSYSLGRLPRGTYRVRFEDDRDYLTGEWWDNAPTLALATDVVVASGATAAGRNATLDPRPGTIYHDIARPTITGTPQVGQVLTASPGSWFPSGATYSYQWLADGVGIPGATTRSLTLTSAQQGRAISVEVTASGPGGSPGKATSAPTARVAAAPVVTPTPTPTPTPQPGVIDTAAELTEILAAVKVAGKAKVGRTLAVKNLVSGARYKLQWYAGKTAIKRATKTKLVLTRALVGKVVSVKVRATTDGVSRTRKVKVGRVRG